MHMTSIRREVVYSRGYTFCCIRVNAQKILFDLGVIWRLAMDPYVQILGRWVANIGIGCPSWWRLLATTAL